MGLSEFFGWTAGPSSTELPDIFPIPIAASDFIKTDIVSLYAMILTDVLERTHGLSDEQSELMFDNCVMSNSSDGLISMLAKAMAEKQELFLVYEKAVGVIRVATGAEATTIRADYGKMGESAVGVFISFKNYTRSDMVKLYSGFDYCAIGSMHKSMNLSKAVQLKMNDLRASVSLADASSAKAQAKEIATSLSSGKDVLLDAKDVIETSSPDLTAVKEAVVFITQKLSRYLGLPAAYLSGEQTGGLGTTGENDMRATERGLKNYFFSVIKPALKAIFGVDVTYKSQDFRQITSSMEVLKTFALVDESLVSADNKRVIINKLLDLPEDAEGDASKKEPLVDPKLLPPAKEAKG